MEHQTVRNCRFTDPNSCWCYRVMPLNTNTIFRGVRFSEPGEQLPSSVLNPLAHRVVSAPLCWHRPCIREDDVEQNRKAEPADCYSERPSNAPNARLGEAKRHAPRNNIREFYKRSAGLEATRSSGVLDFMEPPVPGSRSSSSGRSRPLRWKGQCRQGQRGRLSRPQPGVRHPVRPNSALLCRRKPSLATRRHRQ